MYNKTQVHKLTFISAEIEYFSPQSCKELMHRYKTNKGACKII